MEDEVKNCNDDALDKELGQLWVDFIPVTWSLGYKGKRWHISYYFPTKTQVSFVHPQLPLSCIVFHTQHTGNITQQYVIFKNTRKNA